MLSVFADAEAMPARSRGLAGLVVCCWDHTGCIGSLGVKGPLYVGKKIAYRR